MPTLDVRLPLLGSTCLLLSLLIAVPVDAQQTPATGTQPSTQPSAGKAVPSASAAAPAAPPPTQPSAPPTGPAPKADSATEPTAPNADATAQPNATQPQPDAEASTSKGVDNPPQQASDGATSAAPKGYHDATPAPPAPDTAPTPETPAPPPRGTAEESPIFEPPLPGSFVRGDAPPPPAIRHRAPRNSLWLGARSGVFFPLGTLWQDGRSSGGVCCIYDNRGFDDFATAGPMLELDLGARLGRNYNVFGLWEWGILGKGRELGDAFGGQNGAYTHFLGAGMRFSTRPSEVGIVVEMALGWRQFRTSWDNGTKFVATDDFFNTRIGVGADIRLNEKLSLSPLLTVGGGVFGTAEWTFADGSTSGAFSSLFGDLVDRAGQHVPVTLQIGLHYDAFAASERSP